MHQIYFRDDFGLRHAPVWLSLHVTSLRTGSCREATWHAEPLTPGRRVGSENPLPRRVGDREAIIRNLLDIELIIQFF